MENRARGSCKYMYIVPATQTIVPYGISSTVLSGFRTTIDLRRTSVTDVEVRSLMPSRRSVSSVYLIRDLSNICIASGGGRGLV